MKIAIISLMLGLCAVALDRFPPYNESVTFYQSFDNGDKPDLCLGKTDIVWCGGKVDFWPGIRGKALLCGVGGARIRYTRKDSLNFDNPGTIVLFYQPMNWEQDREKKYPRLFMWGIESSKGYIGVQGANDPKTLCMCERGWHIMLSDIKGCPDKVYCMESLGKESCIGWHMLSFTWAGSRIALKLDDREPRTFELPYALKDEMFPSDTISFGSHDHWNYLLDEVIIYGRRLSNDELNKLYKEVVKK